MKKIYKFSIALIAISMIILLKSSIGVYADDAADVQSLIYRGLAITDGKSSEAYVWVTDAQNFAEKYPNSIAYSFFVNCCSNAKSYNDITLFNTKNKIIGGLLYLESEIKDIPNKSPLELVSETVNILDNQSPEAYRWVLDIMAILDKNPESSVYSSLKNNCSNALSYNDITLFNTKNKIVSDLTVLDGEIVISSVFDGIIIVKSPNKTDYVEGECFNPVGTEINITFINTYRDGSIKTIQKVVTDYTVDTTTKLKTSDTKWTYSYTYEGITKTVSQDISVDKFVPELMSTTLDSISVVAEPKKTEYLIGESFNKKGLKINAKYKNTWSDGSISYTTTKNVDYSVDCDTPLAKSDKKWVISYNDNGVVAKTSVKITVKSSDPVLNVKKKTLTPGDSFRLKVYGTDKFVMWKSDTYSVAEIDDNGLVKVKKTGSAKITATIGSGKKNIKLTCKITVKAKVSADKKVLFLDSEQYETFKVDTSKLKGATYNVYNGSGSFRLVDEGNDVFNVIPENRNWQTLSYISISNDRGYTEQIIPVFLYKDDGNKVMITIQRVYTDDNNQFSYVNCGFGNDSFKIYDEKLYKKLKKYVNSKSSSYAIEISKDSFETIIKKAVKNNKLTVGSY